MSDETREMLIRIEERVCSIQDELKQINADRHCAVHSEQIQQVLQEHRVMKNRMWGVVGVALSSLVAIIIALVEKAKAGTLW